MGCGGRTSARTSARKWRRDELVRAVLVRAVRESGYKRVMRHDGAGVVRKAKRPKGAQKGGKHAHN